MKDEPGLWLCHVCNASAVGESTACSECYKTTCAEHLRHRTVYNKENGLYELMPVCVECLAEEILH